MNLVFESNELDFLILQNGDKGEPGESKYTWIKYSKNADGSNMTDSPQDAVYIGIAYNKDSIQESNNPADYSWSKIQGNKGQDGYTVFLENENISFATDNNKAALSNQSHSSTVHVIQGTEERAGFLIGEIISDNGIKVTKEGNSLQIEVLKGNNFVSDNGYIRIPISIDGLVFFKDITWTLSIQGADGLQGQAALNLVIGNESQNIPCNKDGITPEQMLIEIPFSGYRGFDRVPVSVVVGILPSGITTASIENSTSEKDGLITLNVKDGADLGGKNVLRGKVILSFTIEGQTITKHFVWNKTKDGNEGTMVLYTLSSSTPVLSKQVDDTISPNKLVFSSFVKSNAESKEYAGLFVVKETTDGITYSTKYMSSQNESTIEYTISSNNITGIQCILCESDKVSNELDIITIPVLTNDNLKDQITEIKNTTTEISSKVDKVDNSITNKVWQKDITNQIDNFNNTTVKEIREQVAEQKTEIGNISTKVSDVKTTVETKADGSTVQKLEERITNNEQTAEGLKQTVEQNYVTNDKLGETSQTLRSELEQTAGKIQGKVDALNGNVTTVTQTVEEVEQRVETAEGDIASLKVQAGNIHLEVGKKDDVIPTQIRYIRDYLNGNDKDETNHFCMIEVLSNETNLSSGVINLSSGLVPTSDAEITDAANYTDSDLNTYASTPSGNHYLQLDLKSGEEPIPQVDSIHIWHYSDNRKCKHKLQVSEDGVTWYTLYNSELQGDYSETSDGKIYYIDDNTISKNMAFIDASINEITQKVQENENNYASITTEIGKVTTRVEEVESVANEVINTALPNLESNINKKIADIQVTADGITNSVVKIEDDLKQQAQEILEAGKWKVSLANIGGYDSKYADTEVYMELTPNGLTVSRSASDGYKTQITGDTIRIDYDNGRGQYDNAMLIDRDLMHLTRVFVKNGIDHGTIKEIPQRYGTIGTLVFVSSVGSNS